MISIMKNYCLFLAILFCFFQMNADNVKTVTVSFDKNDFNMEYDDEGLLHISSYKHIIDYGDDYTLPGLPKIPVNAIIPEGYSYVGYDVNQHKTSFLDNVIVAAVPVAVPTNSSAAIQPQIIDYADSYYPKASVELIDTSDYGSQKTVSFLVSPFEYDASNKKLNFVDEFTLNIHLKPVVAKKKSFANRRVNDVIKNIIVNPEDIKVNPTKSVFSESALDFIEYVIITSSALEDAFEPLVTWKTTKGVRAKVVTTEYIDSHYEGATSQLKIKNCLFDLYLNNGLKYALLGGDDTVVPAQGCYGNVDDKKIDENIPTDLYYACFAGTFNWDANGNGIYGELTDSIDLSPYIFVTRAPVRTVSHTSAFVGKILEYEKDPKSSEWSNTILTGGSELHHAGDVEVLGDVIYNNYIKTYWKGKRTRFYDTATDFVENAEYDFTAGNIQEQLSRGYNFVSILTHGDPTSWQTEKGRGYLSSDGSSLNMEKFSIITTIACLTNAFDSSSIYGPVDPCLSESFIRNANNGVVAYLGGSRFGWFALGWNNVIPITYSLRYEALFYKSLFSPEIADKHFGSLVALVKASMKNLCNTDGSNRWVQFCLNPIGDPEMPVFIDTPKSLGDVTVTRETNRITVNTNVPDCRICVTDYNGGVYFKTISDVQNATFTEVPSVANVCITKQGYLPVVYVVSDNNVYLQNETITEKRNVIADNVVIGSDVTTNKASGPVSINGQTLIKAKSVTLDNGIIIEDNAYLILKND